MLIGAEHHGTLESKQIAAFLSNFIFAVSTSNGTLRQMRLTQAALILDAFRSKVHTHLHTYALKNEVFYHFHV